jgi:hypothetical protein
MAVTLAGRTICALYISRIINRREITPVPSCNLFMFHVSFSLLLHICSVSAFLDLTSDDQIIYINAATKDFTSV